MGAVTPTRGDDKGMDKQNEAQLGLATALAEPENQRETHLRWGSGDLVGTILLPF